LDARKILEKCHPSQADELSLLVVALWLVVRQFLEKCHPNEADEPSLVVVALLGRL
jgi:hypothetical protein